MDIDMSRTEETLYADDRVHKKVVIFYFNSHAWDKIKHLECWQQLIRIVDGKEKL